MLKRIVFPIFALSVVVAVYAGDQPSTQPARPESNSSQHDDFPFAISFELGATQFQSGDRITITEVRGTSSDMQSGICRISGTYTLASHDKATLAASVTARESADGSGPPLQCVEDHGRVVGRDERALGSCAASIERRRG